MRYFIKPVSYLDKYQCCKASWHHFLKSNQKMWYNSFSSVLKVEKNIMQILFSTAKKWKKKQTSTTLMKVLPITRSNTICIKDSNIWIFVTFKHLHNAQIENNIRNIGSRNMENKERADTSVFYIYHEIKLKLFGCIP